ncbi:MAG: YqjD family protein [Sulfurifustaceae bacterium]
MAIQPEAAREKLIADFKAVIQDTEKLLRATAGQTGERITAARARLEERLASARDDFNKLSRDAVARGQAAMKSTDVYVRAHPWQSIGIAAAVGLAVGLITARR